MELIPITETGYLKVPGPMTDATLATIRTTREWYQATGFHPPWGGYLGMQNDSVIGTCAFKSPPDKGRVEIAYHTFPEFEGKGLGTRMAAALIHLACRQDQTLIPFAQTLSVPNASTRILEKLGFHRVADQHDPEVGIIWEWELRRPTERENFQE